MKIIDTHCDTATCLYEQKKSIYENDLHISLKNLSKYRSYVQFFAVFSDPVYHSTAVQRAMAVIDNLYCEIEKHSDKIELCTNKTQMYKAVYAKKTAAFLSLEGGEAITDLAMLRNFYRLGVRCIAPTWNVSNHIASSCMENNPGIGLTEFGTKMIREMDRLKILTDVSHISDRAFWDIAELCTLPFIATHSNSRTVCGNRRNLTDEQFKEIIRHNGCAGLNLYPPFLSESASASLSDAVRHIEYFMSLGGENNVGIGADFDGVEELPKGIFGAADLYKLFNELSKIGYSDILLEKIAWGNFNRVISVLK